MFDFIFMRFIICFCHGFSSRGSFNFNKFIKCKIIKILIFLFQAITVNFLNLAGYFAAADNYLPYLIPFEYLSGFKYGFQILVEHEFLESQALNCHNNLERPCLPLENSFVFKEKSWVSVICLIGVIIFFQAIAILFINFKSKQKA